MPAPLPLPDPNAVKHTLLDDIQGLATGVVMCALGLVLLTNLGLMTGPSFFPLAMTARAPPWIFF